MKNKFALALIFYTLANHEYMSSITVLCILIPFYLPFIRAMCVYLNMGGIFMTSWIFVRLSNLIGDLLDHSNEQKSRRASYWFQKINKFYLSMLFWIKFRIEGNDDVTKKVIFTSNHISYLDGFATNLIFNKMIGCNNNVNLVGVDYVEKIPFIGYVFNTIGYIPVKFEKTKLHEKNKYIKENVKKVYDECELVLNNGKSIAMYFEGKRNLDPTKLNEIKYGVYNLHKKTNTPVKFMGIKGIYNIWPTKKHPTGYGTVILKLFDNTFIFDDADQYKNKIIEIYTDWIKNQ